MQSKYTKSARDQQCQVRLPNICNWNPETTVFAHLSGAGLAKKHSDIHGAYCCSDCHDVLDGRNSNAPFSMTEKKIAHYEGMVRTQKIMIDEGVLKL